MEITLYDFIQLDLNAKADKLWEHGSYIDSYINFEKRVNLYFLSNFFVEVYLDSNSIIEISAFKKGERFDKYLERINIS